MPAAASILQMNGLEAAATDGQLAKPHTLTRRRRHGIGRRILGLLDQARRRGRPALRATRRRHGLGRQCRGRQAVPAPGGLLASARGDARARAGFREIPKIAANEFDWPDIESPETAAIWAADPFIGREQALEVAFEAESAGLAYYRNILETTQDPEIRAFAKEFVEEETLHVAELQRWMELHLAGKPLPVDR
jgi:hypothetical protein